MKPGNVGAIIHIHPNEEAFVVEFMPLDGETVATATVLPSQVRSVTSADLTHARTVPEHHLRYSLTDSAGRPADPDPPGWCGACRLNPVMTEFNVTEVDTVQRGARVAFLVGPHTRFVQFADNQ